MRAVNIAELKNNLSAYLKAVKQGEEIIVRDRNVPVARIVPLSSGYEDELASLAARGLVRLGQGPIGEEFWQLPAPAVSDRIVAEALAADRDDD